MEKRTQVLITFISLVLLIFFLYVFTDWFSKITGYFTGEEEIRKIIICLNENDAEFYTSVFCAECDKQQKLFGEPFKAIRQVDCGRDKELCPNIQSIPAWYINKSIHYGYKNLTELKAIGGCG